MATARGILSYGAYLPFRRLDRAGIRPVAGTGGGTGTRTVAGYDEDTTTLGVAAARPALAAAPGGVRPASLWFATVAPAYADKTNATAVHAALHLDAAAPAFDACGAVRSAVGTLRAGLAAASAGEGPALVVAADVRTGLPGSADEAAGGDAGAALLVGSADEGPLAAEVVGWGSATEEFLDRWRTPGDTRSRQWEERFGEQAYAALGARAWDDALKDAGVLGEQVDRVVVAAAHARAGASLAKRLGVTDRVAPGLEATVGFAGAAHPALALAAALDEAGPGETVALVVLADGADVVLLRTTEALAAARPARSVAAQVAAGGPIAYGTFLAWRGQLAVEPPRRPEPARPSATAAARSREWKYALVDAEAGPRADATGTIATFTIDRLAYSPSPPVVFAVVDLDGGAGRLPVELTDVDAADVAIGDRVEMTFRRLFTADGIHNYFWKARPVRGEGG
ncbi:MAG TPA: OB-fold domain-containing protein [Acidimicrobiales bacterium]|nr:OB-fold domain-containing protein [Acidimicrobiales bacterium]